MSFDINGKTLSGLAQKQGDTLWVHLNGRTFTYRPLTASGRKKSGQSKALPGELVAPLPGKIIKLPVQSGDEVEENQILVVMEAMKMEYTLKAPFATVVEEVFCTEGDQVKLSQKLVKLKNVEQSQSG